MYRIDKCGEIMQYGFEKVPFREIGVCDMLLIKNAEVYAPASIGKKDILICNEKIELIEDNIEGLPGNCRVMDGEGLLLAPGMIDQHIHVTGGGGEGSFHTRTPELDLSEMIKGGITTAVGLLGTDGITRSVENLYAKTAALNEEGVTAYMLTGAYGYPGPSITGEPDRDIMFVKEVLGMKLALSDHRAPNVTPEQLMQISSRVRVAGMLSGKPGVVVLHMGDAPEGLEPVYEALEKSTLPIRNFRPTHVNRNKALLEAGYGFLEKGGYVDYTCGMKGQPSPGQCIAEAAKRGLPLAHITISSDGHGSWSSYDEDGTLLDIGVSGVDSLYKELRLMVKDLGMPLEDALGYVTSHVAEALDMYPEKGCIKEGADADMLLFTEQLDLHTVIARGAVMMEGGVLKRKGTYER